jgi:aminoglycoside phosphotransferase (APT) family kinase protein
MNIDKHLAQKLISEQFPEWGNLPINQVIPGGWDNRTFRLGNDKLIRLPSAECYASNVEKEQHWLPIFAPHIRSCSFSE